MDFLALLMQRDVIIILAIIGGVIATFGNFLVQFDTWQLGYFLLASCWVYLQAAWEDAHVRRFDLSQYVVHMQPPLKGYQRGAPIGSTSLFVFTSMRSPSRCQ